MGITSRPFFARLSANAPARYAVALAAALVALLVRQALNPLVGFDVPFITLFPAVIFAAWFCGIGPSIASVAVGLLAARYLFFQPPHSLSVPNLPQSVDMIAFVLASAFTPLPIYRCRREIVTLLVHGAATQSVLRLGIARRSQCAAGLDAARFGPGRARLRWAARP